MEKPFIEDLLEEPSRQRKGLFQRPSERREIGKSKEWKESLLCLKHSELRGVTERVSPIIKSRVKTWILFSALSEVIVKFKQRSTLHL